MTGSIAAELLVLRKRASTWILLGVWVLLAIFFGYLIPYISYRNNAGDRASGLPPDLLPQNLVGTLIGGFPFYGGAIALMLGVLAMGSEYDWGTLKTLFTQRPGRLRVFAAKLLALAVVLAPFVVLAFAAGAAASLAIAWGEGAAVAWPSAWLLVRAILGDGLILTVWAALGVTLAVLSRGTALAIGIGVLYALAIEGLFSNLLNASSLFRPIVAYFMRANAYSLVQPLGGAAEAAQGGPGAFAGPFVGWERALLVLAAYLAGFVLLAAILIRRRDVA